MTSERDMEAAREMFEKLRSNMPYSEKLEYIAAALAKVRVETAGAQERLASEHDLDCIDVRYSRGLSKNKRYLAFVHSHKECRHAYAASADEALDAAIRALSKEEQQK